MAAGKERQEKRMSYADQVFINMCQDIIENGTSTEGEKVRPKWPDGSYAYTIKRFGVVNRYDLSKEFPALTLRRTGLKSCMDEILWIYQKKSNNIHDLNSHIWDEWADETGSIGKAYCYQIGVNSHYKEGDMDKMDRVLFDMKALRPEGQPLQPPDYDEYLCVLGFKRDASVSLRLRRHL